MCSLYHYNYTYTTCIYDTKLIASLYACSFPVENTKLITYNA